MDINALVTSPDVNPMSTRPSPPTTEMPTSPTPQVATTTIPTKIAPHCYCGHMATPHRQQPLPITCIHCQGRFHPLCIKSAKAFFGKLTAPLLGDDYFRFECSLCRAKAGIEPESTHDLDPMDRLQRLGLGWLDVVHITLYNLTARYYAQNANNGSPPELGTGQPLSQSAAPPFVDPTGRPFFHWKQDIAAFIQKHWGHFWIKPRSPTWQNSVSSALSVHSHGPATTAPPGPGGKTGPSMQHASSLLDVRFESGKLLTEQTGLWALIQPTTLPQRYDLNDSSLFAHYQTIDALLPKVGDRKARQISCDIVQGDAKLVSLVADALPSDRVKRAKTHQSESPLGLGLAGLGPPILTGKRSTFVRFGRGKFDKRPAISMWPDIENPNGPVLLSTETTNTAPQVRVSSDGQTVTNDKGYRMCKATHGVTVGAWYYETTVASGPDRGSARIGWSQISGDLQGPCGLDHYSYSLRNQPATRFHASHGHSYGESLGEDDVLGCLLCIPALTLEQQTDLERRRFILVRDKRYTPFNYILPTDGVQLPDGQPEPMPRLDQSCIVYFKNGQCLGPAFTNLYLGKYYPAVSCFMGAQVHANFGPDFKYPPPAEWNGIPVLPMSECAAESYMDDYPTQ
ncbi:transcription factor, contains a PHD finger motif [Dimargaris verticillata]|uniref:Transcription factor, contains a PHD finger motif n=1 Tax=Dimargaris verticillata TaxID=2761393 RepID=A0A9W8ECN6_9FUNG|nr:transcription factor, contains a PHD finger motif [Dimargaris verticillata]